MDINSVMNWVSNALVCGLLAVVLVTSWVWFIWSRIHARRARNAMVDEEQSRPPGLVRVNDLLESWENAPWRSCEIVLKRLGERMARRTGSWWDD